MANTTETNKTAQETKSTDIREVIKTTASKMGPDVSPEEKKEHAKVLIKIFEKGMSPKQAMNINDGELSVIYSYAYQLFNNGKYPEACELFKMLFVLEPEESGFASAIGACHYKMKHYEEAMLMYMIHAQISPYDPTPLFHCYDCFLRLENYDAAYLMLVAASKRAEIDKKYEKMKFKIDALIAGFDLSKITEIADITERKIDNHPE